MAKRHETLVELARRGAKARLQEIERELAQIRRMFPDLSNPRSSSDRRRGRRTMSAAARRAVSARMKKYWAARRKQKAARQ